MLKIWYYHSDEWVAIYRDDRKIYDGPYVNAPWIRLLQDSGIQIAIMERE